MNPQNDSQGGDSLGPVGSSSPQNDQTQDQKTAAANVIRTQIDALYGDRQVAEPRLVQSRDNLQARRFDGPVPERSNTPAQAEQPQTTEAANPYERTHEAHPQPQEDQWKAYHSAWQNYYQQYYSSYYEHKTNQEQAQRETDQLAKAAASQTDQKGEYFSAQPEPQPTPAPEAQNEEDITKDEALFELRQKLLGKVKKQATKIRGSRHFIPIVAALSVVLIFVFLQYNRVFIATVNAYVSPGSVDPQNIVIDPSAGTTVSADPRLIIPKINVDVPAVYGVGADHNSQMAAMEKGVAHFAIPGANSHPGEVGNTVLSGHSSNDLFDPGDYKFIFAQLDNLVVGDTLYANYEGTRYTYVITKKEVVLPTQVDKLIYPTDKPVMTLITCTPLGTAEKRLLITAEQISPDPGQATAAPEGSGTPSANSDAIPGNSPTLLERLFGAR